MSIGEIGESFPTTEEVNYFSFENLLDFDVLLVDLDFIYRLLHPTDKKIYETILRRKEDFMEFIRIKKCPLLVFASTSSLIYFNLSGKQQQYYIDFLLPETTFEISALKGTKFKIVNNTPFSTFFKKYEQQLTYNAVFNNFNGSVLAETLFNHRSISFFNDKIIMMPRFNPDKFEPDSECVDDLVTIVKSIANGTSVTYSLPEWTSRYYLPGEEIVDEKINSLKSTIQEQQKSLKELEALHEGISQHKILFSGSGLILEQRIGEIFKSLSFDILESEPNRSDLIVRYQNKIAVVEVKGVKGSGTEKQASQLEKWVMSYYDIHDLHPKGILVVNAFTETPLEQRTQDAFTNQMIPFSTKREHCLLTGIQLLGLYFYCQSHPAEKEAIILKLFNTTGLFPDFIDWKDFVTMKP